MVMKTIKIIKPTKPSIPKKIRVAAYARVSVQGELNAHSLGAQTDYYANLIASNPNWENVGIFADYGITGTTADRPGFQKLMPLCDKNKVDLILVKSISRFCRNTVDLLNTTRRLKEKNINVRFEKENIDSISPNGELMLTLLASFAQEESRSISENTRWAIQKGYQMGKVHNVTQYGYAWDGIEFHIIEEEAEVVRKIFSLYLEGRSPQQIETLFEQNGITSRGGHFCYSHIWTALRCEHYIGDSLFQKTYCADFMTHHRVKNIGQIDSYYAIGTHPPIIDKETWDKVQAEIKRREELGYLANQNINTSCFTSKVFCGKCGRTYRRRIEGMKRRVTRLYKWICGTKISGTSKACNAQNLPEKQLYELTSEVLCCENFTKELFDSKIEKIVVSAPSTLTFYLKDGSTVDKRWLIETPNTKIKEAINGKVSNNNTCNTSKVLV